ncbi:MAG TPA: N-acetylmuramoyl-L-alanine amidase, partial [Tepidisphaeraceae bacterium]|nr:N-acetylmuramoyl-L-alanine amidase [Tepidisphaeraceae bacterium]
MRSIQFILILLVALHGCSKPQPSTARFGDEIVVAGKFFRIGTPVVSWLDPGGYDAYRIERRFVPIDQSSWSATTQTSDLKSPNRFNLRYESTAASHYTPEQLEQVRGGGWTLELLQQTIDQFILHYDVAGFSQNCFKILQDERGLSVHFLLDLDGTIYQTLDVKERAWHATKSNDRSIGIEIANVGAHPRGQIEKVYKDWFVRDEAGIVIQIPEAFGSEAKRLNAKKLRPSRPDLIVGSINQNEVEMYDFTPQQYDSLVKLTAVLCEIFPKLKPEAPRDS